MITDSEKILANINGNIFFKEFTYTDEDRCEGKELCDGFIYLDDYCLAFQVKERDNQSIKGHTSEKKWFKDNVLRDAKKQIKNTIAYLTNAKQKKIITNLRGDKLKLETVNPSLMNYIIIYAHEKPNLIEEITKSNKIILSSKASTVHHVMDINSYKKVSEYLITPTEFLSYLKFRQSFFNYCNEIKSSFFKELDELSLLSIFFKNYDEMSKTFGSSYHDEIDAWEMHFKFHKLENDNKTDKKEDFSKNLEQMNAELFNIKYLICHFKKRLVPSTKQINDSYQHVLKLLAKLNRNEVITFNEKFKKSFTEAQNNRGIFPSYKFAFPSKSICFSILSVPNNVSESNIEQRFKMELDLTHYKYRKYDAKNCLVCIMQPIKDSSDIDIFWTYMLDKEPSKYDSFLEKFIEKEKSFYQPTLIISRNLYD